MSFCKHQDIEVLDMDACFSSVERSRRKTKSVTVEHHYRVDIFTAIIDQQLQELNNIFTIIIDQQLQEQNNRFIITQSKFYIVHVQTFRNNLTFIIS
jgi:hypothetical protein